LIERRYVKKDKKSLVPTDLGKKITKDIMEEYFHDVVDVNFTSDMESNLDKVAEGELKWKNVVSDYYDILKDEIRTAKEQAEKVQPEIELVDETCPNCGRQLAKKHSRYGDFLACTGFPECKYTKSIVIDTGIKCPACGGNIIVKRSKKGKTFYGCSNYPECEQVYWYKPVDKKCPNCGSLLVERGRMLYCSDPNCGYREKK
jgi:DNA topoisomerase-1